MAGICIDSDAHVLVQLDGGLEVLPRYNKEFNE